MKNDKYRQFYEKVFWGDAMLEKYKEHRFDSALFSTLNNFLDRFSLRDKKILEIGSSHGAMQDIVSDYTGIDIVPHLKDFYHKPYFALPESEQYPFHDNTFDGIFSYAVFEHIPKIDNALNETVRVLKPGGVVFLNPAWQVRPWAAGGYEARKYGELNWIGKLIKASIPIRNNILFMLLHVAPKRVWRTIRFILSPASFDRLEYRKLKANYDDFLVPDSDACNHIDPHAAILWFFAHGCTVINYPTLWRAFFVRSGALIVQKK